MRNIILKILPSKAGRCIRIFALLGIVAMAFDTSNSTVLVANAGAAACTWSMDGGWTPPGCNIEPGGPGGGPVPELPTVMIPLFLLVTGSSFYYIRRRRLQA